MTPTTLHETSARPGRRMRRTVALTAIAAFGLMAPAAAGALPGETPPAPDGPGGFTAEEPDECNPLLASCDITNPTEDPEDCPPPAATCDLTNPTENPDPEDPDEPDEVEPSGNPSASVDTPVRATPNFTG